MLDIILHKYPNSCKVYNFTLTTLRIKKAEGRGGLTLTPGYDTPLYAVSQWGLVMFSAAFDKPVYGEGKYYQFPRVP